MKYQSFRYVLRFKAICANCLRVLEPGEEGYMKELRTLCVPCNNELRKKEEKSNARRN